MSEKASRGFSKKMAVANCLAAWAVIAFVVWRTGSDEIVRGCLALIGFILSCYMGVGFLDYRAKLKAGDENA
ncbi:hypothetical protein [Sulfitobacter guttiformis]|uniref:Uncharacterized protein n=1 Tax=Sulfitobacter guttiformis TaxID=74349 RepID=A0A420DH95_9RHOB|nr:hypothetical protein [Sulfitobacter guttiformis]KIN72684.1 hypothetical protein Z949_1862 [Sulfitobacter guttiformis KCTC 32187]RKE93589.1 hypothetical protein C8N30_2666 [Sulfitobacter guttiformis]